MWFLFTSGFLPLIYVGALISGGISKNGNIFFESHLYKVTVKWFCACA